jgi:hypothetical protein
VLPIPAPPPKLNPGGFIAGGTMFPLWVVPAVPAADGERQSEPKVVLLPHKLAEASFRAGKLLQDKLTAAALAGAVLHADEGAVVKAAAALGATIEDSND